MARLPLEQTHSALWRATHKLRGRYASLWALEHLTYTVLRRGGPWTARRLAIHEALVSEATRYGFERQPVPDVTDASPEAFQAAHLEAGCPGVFRGVASSWPAARWTPEHIAAIAGDARIRLLAVAPNQPKGRPGHGRDVSYRAVADSMAAGGELYARFSGLLHERPELIEDLDVTWFRDMRRDHRRFENWGLFMGGADTATALHASIAPNLFLQITGRKRWLIYPAGAAGFLAPAVRASPYFYSHVDVSDPERFPVAEHAPGWVVDLEPGDILYVPPFAWHQVHNHSASLAVGYRWMNVRMGLKASVLQTVLAATGTNPPPWRAKGHRDLPTLLDAVDY